MNSTVMTEQEKISREEMVELLNEDLAREYQAIIAYIVYSQTLKGAAYTAIAGELEKHATEELAHAVKIAREFLQTRLPECPVLLDSPFARREPVGDHHRWSVMFERVMPPDVVVSPGEVIVLVDEVTGAAEIEYVI